MDFLGLDVQYGLIHNGLMLIHLRDYLKRHRLTHAEFGLKLDPPVSASKVSHWVQGTRRVSLVEALQIETLTHGELEPRRLVCERRECVTATQNAKETACV